MQSNYEELKEIITNFYIRKFKRLPTNSEMYVDIGFLTKCRTKMPDSRKAILY